MNIYQLTKTNINNLLSQVTNKNAMTFIFNDKGQALVYCMNSLSAFLPRSSKLNKGNYKYSFVVSSSMDNNELSNLFNVINDLDSNYQVSIRVSTHIITKKVQHKSKASKSNSTSTINDIIKAKSNASNTINTYKLKIEIQSDSLSILQHFKTLNNSLKIFKPFILSNAKVVIDYSNLSKFLDTKTFNEGTKEVLEGIKIGTTKNNKDIISTYKALDRHLKIEGVNGSGKSGALISQAVNLIDNDKSVVFIDPHNQTAIQIYQSLKKIDKVKVLKIKNQDKYIGVNCLIHYGSIQERLEHSEAVTVAFFSQEIEERYLTTVDTAKVLITAFIEFNYNYLVLLHEQGKTKAEIELIIKDKQLTINDLVNIQNNESLQILIAKMIVKTNPSLSTKFLQFNTTFSKIGLDACLSRFKEAVNTTTGIAFFEGRGFLTDYNTLQGNSILCLLNDLSPLNRSIISKLCFSSYFNLHKQGVIKNKTYLIVDESASSKLPNLMEIITESRKFNLHLTLAYQGLNMWSKKEQEAINLIPNSIEFSTNSNPKAIREFSFKSIDYLDLVIGKTIDYPNSNREWIEPNQGQTFEYLYSKIQEKQKDINKYFGI